MRREEELVAFARESLGLKPDAEIRLIPFEGRGSDRTYYRLLWSHESSAILVHYDPGRVENTYYANIARFLSEHEIPVPQILRHEDSRCFILMEDLGDTDLWRLRHEPWEVRKRLYQDTLRIVHRLHSYPEDLFPSGKVKLMEAFGPNLYRWERDYFRDNFVKMLCSIELDSAVNQKLETELSGVAERLTKHPHTLVHRDLQSQNVMIWRDVPFLIDFQGMRFGTRFYDLGSILCDPYVSLSEQEKEDLLLFYYELSEQELDWTTFQNAFWEASAQRLMQALGAYGFLGVAKGLKSYLAHVPAAIKNLVSAAERATTLPVLLEVCVHCRQAIGRKSNSIGQAEKQQ